MCTEADQYNTSFFIKPPAAVARATRQGKRSRATTPLEKFWRSWQDVRTKGQDVSLVLKSNWSWCPEDPLAEHVGGYDAHVFTNAGDRRIHDAARGYLKTDPGRQVLPWVGVPGELI